MKNDALFFAGILLIIFVTWVATGGPSRPVSWAGPFLTPLGPGQTGGEGYGALSTGIRIGGSGISLGSGSRTPAQTLTSAERELEALKRQLAEQQRFGEPSIHRGVVVIQKSSSGPKRTQARDESIIITVSRQAKEPITISGWRIGSAVTGTLLTIPQGAEVPYSGTISAIEPIILKPGDRAIITTGRSPIGASFRVNMCTGYLEQYQSFSPSLPRTCPLAKDELKNFYSDYLRDEACLQFAEDIPRCTIATNIPPHLSSSCRSFLTERIHYNGCVSRHRNDTNFFENEWRVFLGQNNEIWKQEREVIKLFDAEGKTVDMYSY